MKCPKIWVELTRNHYNWTLDAFQGKTKRIIWENFGDDVCEEQYRYLYTYDTKNPMT